jgi:hypothetical protein
MVRDAPKDIEFRVYFKLMKQGAEHQTTNAAGYILLSLDGPVALPLVELKNEGEMVRVATIRQGADGHATVHIDLPGAKQPEPRK